MNRTTGSVALALLVTVCLPLVTGCAGTRGDEALNDPELIRKELAEIEEDILNTEEIYKASLTELQMEESIELRREVNRLWTEIEHLRSRKAALEERLAELQAQESSG